MKRREFIATSAALSGALLSRLSLAQTRPCPLPAFNVQGGTGVTNTCNASTQAADWQSRISGPGVVWYHGFETDDEVNNFRWTNGFGNDPGAKGGANSASIIRVTSDGTDKGNGQCCMQVGHPAGTGDNSYWWRPLGPIAGGTTTGNGRGAGKNDPGANGAIAMGSWDPSNNDATASWGAKSIYGNSQYWNTAGQSYDGSECYLQLRVKHDPARWATAKNRNVTSGKLIWFNRTNNTLTDQEMVVESYTDYAGGTDNTLSIYRGCGFVPIHQDDGANRPQVGSDLSTLWTYPNAGQWVTLLFHLRYGTMTGGLGSCTGQNTLLQIWEAAAGATSYTKIWDQADVKLGYDFWYGHNALLLAAYNNNYDLDAFYTKFDQVIFSRQTIPCPQA